ncbi:hypothetical protein P7C70_g4985, partial [Phenoliferia sp. Uapishka_3]
MEEAKQEAVARICELCKMEDAETTLNEPLRGVRDRISELTVASPIPQNWQSLRQFFSSPSQTFPKQATLVTFYATMAIPRPLVYALWSVLAARSALAAPSMMASSGFTASFARISRASLSGLNESVGGRLEYGYPAAQPCFQKFEGSLNDPKTDQQKCEEVQAGWKTEAWYASSDSFGAYPTAGWSTCQAKAQSCLLDYQNVSDPDVLATTCFQGSVPPLYIAVQQPSDIQAAFTFVKKHNIPLVIKNTGHDYKGRSSAPSSLALWTHQLNTMSYSNAFVAERCPRESVSEAVILGSGVTSHQAIEFAESLNRTLVTGACGSVGLAGGWYAAGGHSAISNDVSTLMSILPERAANVRADTQHGLGVKTRRRTPLQNRKHHAETYIDTGELWYSPTARSGSGSHFLLHPVCSKTVINFITPSALAETQRAMRSGLMTAYPVDPTRPVYGAPLQLEFATPFNTPAIGGTSETPAWRTAVVHAIFTAATYWNSTSEEITASNTQVSAATQYLRDISPDSGAYLSESALHEPEWQKSFWGLENYAKLSALKKKYDPHTLLTSWHAIDFDPEDERFRCYP